VEILPASPQPTPASVSASVQSPAGRPRLGPGRREAGQRGARGSAGPSERPRTGAGAEGRPEGRGAGGTQGRGREGCTHRGALLCASVGQSVQPAVARPEPELPAARGAGRRGRGGAGRGVGAGRVRRGSLPRPLPCLRLGAGSRLQPGRGGPAPQLLAEMRQASPRVRPSCVRSSALTSPDPPSAPPRPWLNFAFQESYYCQEGTRGLWSGRLSQPEPQYPHRDETPSTLGIL
jgi:hypothetical protein